MKKVETPSNPELEEILCILKRNKTANFTTENNAGKPFMSRVNFSFILVDGKLKITLDFRDQMVNFYRHKENIGKTHDFDFAIAEHKTIGKSSDLVYQNIYIKKGLIQFKGRAKIEMDVYAIIFRQMTGVRREISF